MQAREIRRYKVRFDSFGAQFSFVEGIKKKANNLVITVGKILLDENTSQKRSTERFL